MAIETELHSDLQVVKELIYAPCGFIFSNLKWNPESAEYSACSFDLDGMKIEHRVSKITPKKIGQFVAIWKRNESGITEPFDIDDDIDFIAITSKSGDNIGQFIFPKSVLASKGIITENGKEGKRGIRVYPPWDTAKNEQAKKTQSWQTKYFVWIIRNDSAYLDFAKQLLNNAQKKSFT